jgi:hypothetical protein
MKIIYVDIDGPLATDECSRVLEKTKWHPKLYRMNAKCVGVLNEILKVVECEMVVSSDWRTYFTLEELGEIFEWNGIIKKPIGITNRECVSFNDITRNRIHQIKLSVEELKPEAWVAIDDLPIGMQYLTYGVTNHVFCDPIEGLSVYNKQLVIDFLNNKQNINGNQEESTGTECK